MTPQEALRLADTIRSQRGAQGESALEVLICHHIGWDFFPSLDPAAPDKKEIEQFLEFLNAWHDALLQVYRQAPAEKPKKKAAKKAFKHQEETQDVFD